MASRNAVALQTDFDTPEDVSEVYSPDPVTDYDSEFLDHPDDDTLYMIEQEYCFIRPDRKHLYLDDSMRCCACGTAHPSVRKVCGQR